MRQKVSDYIADFLAKNEITDLFSVVGGGAMHLNDSFGHHPSLTVTYNHHEQGSAIAAEAYARLTGKIAAVCVTSGPGATNAITGALCGWMGSVPMMIFSGQVRTGVSVRSNNLHLRTMGEQEIDIEPVVRPITKYAKMVLNPQEIRYHLEKALYLAYHGRPGPVWLDLPLDVQGAMVETDDLPAFNPAECAGELPPEPTEQTLKLIIEKIAAAKRPVLYLGQGARSDYNAVLELAQRLNIPVTTGMSSVDQIWNDHPLYAGRPGATGDRAGNFAVQNSDLLLSIGSRLSFKQTGYNTATWAREAFKIMVDIDPAELEKPQLGIDLKVWADAGEFARKMLQLLPEGALCSRQEWIDQCKKWVEDYPVVHGESDAVKENGCTNIYTFYAALSDVMRENDVLIVSAGTARVAGSQAFRIKRGQRFIVNASTATMGYDLPAAVGVGVALKQIPFVCVTGEGSLQMNLQEFQTILQNKIPMKLFVINNQGYHSIRQTQHNYFQPPLVGVGEESGDLSFPDLGKLIPAYGLPYLACHQSEELHDTIQKALAVEGPCVCEVFVTKLQKTEPKLSSKKLENGSFYSAPLEDMAPFLPREELRKNLYIAPVEGEL